MKLLKDKYGRFWLVKQSTYTLLNINHIGVLNKKIEVTDNLITEIK